MFGIGIRLGNIAGLSPGHIKLHKAVCGARHDLIAEKVEVIG